MRERKIVGNKKPVKRKRMVLRAKGYEEWKTYIIICLERFGNKKRNPSWGCLDRAGKLFEISTMVKKNVPMKYVTRMELNGLIKLDKETGFFALIKQRRRRRLS